MTMLIFKGEISLVPSHQVLDGITEVYTGLEHFVSVFQRNGTLGESIPRTFDGPQ